MNSRLLQLFNIRTDEAPLVNNLFWLQFFQGVGVAIFNVIAFALFLGQFDVQQLPKVYVFSALLLWLSGWVYSKIEHAVSVKNLVLAVILFNAATVLLFQLHFIVFGAAWLIFLMFSWYYVIYLLSNLEFWGMAALLFDVRQSKRLFSMIGAGDIPAKLIGYLLIPGLVKVIGAENTLYFSFASMLISLIFYFRLRNSGHLELHVKHEHSHDSTADRFATIRTGEFFKTFLGNKLIAMVAALSFAVITCVTIISFSFYAEVKHASHTNEQLADFIALFYAGGGLLSLLVRILFTGKLRHRLGTKGTLLLSPVFIFVFCLYFLLVLPFVPHSGLSILYIFATLYFVSESLKISLQDSVFLSLMQPLSSALRLKAHTIVKGIMDPFALATTGLILMVALNVWGKIDLFVMCFLLLAFVIFWVVMIFLTDREYLKTVESALNKRYSVGHDIDLRSEHTRQILLDKISGVDKWEAIYVLRLIENHYSASCENLILKALTHPEPEVRIDAIRIVEKKKIAAALPVIDAILAAKKDMAVLPEAVKAKCMLSPSESEKIDIFLDEKNLRLLQAAITGLMKSGGISAVVLAGQKLLQLIASPSAEDRKIAASIIGELGVHYFYKSLLELLSDPDDDVVKAAITSCGNVKNEKLSYTLLHDFLLKGKYERPVIHAICNSGPVSLKPIEQILLAEDTSRKYQVKLIHMIGQIGTDEGIEILDRLIPGLPPMQNNIFHALHLCMFRVSPHNRKLYLQLIQQHLDYGIRLLFMLNTLEQSNAEAILINSLNLELSKIRDSLLLLFSFIYDKEKMIKAKNAFILNKKENVANALEIIEIEVPSSFSLLFIKIFEPGKTRDKCGQLPGNLNMVLNIDEIIDAILNDKFYSFHRWTKATALYSLDSYNGENKFNWLEKASHESDLLLKEIGQKAMAPLS